MPDERKLTDTEKMLRDRERAEARCDQHFEELVESYPAGHRSARDTFIRRESEKITKEVENRQLDATPDPEGRRRFRP
jgi:hypothetical protein